MSEGEGGSESAQQDPQDSVWQPGGRGGGATAADIIRERERERERERDYTPSCQFIRNMQLSLTMLSV